MSRFVFSLFEWFTAFLRSRNSVGLEIVALRLQISVLKRKNHRPRLSPWDQLIWVFLRRVWSRWAEVLVRSEEHTSELQSRPHLVCRLLLEKKKNRADSRAD